jgi:hypothetical protein
MSAKVAWFVHLKSDISSFLLFLMWPRVPAQKVQKVAAAGDGAGNHGGRREQGR